MAVGGLEKVS